MTCTASEAGLLLALDDDELISPEAEAKKGIRSKHEGMLPRIPTDGI